MSLRQLRARLDRLEVRFPEGDEESIALARSDQLYHKLLAGGPGALTESENLEWIYLWIRFHGLPMLRPLRERMGERAEEYLAKEEEQIRLCRLEWQNSLNRAAALPE
jgi:hypothetical protein